MSAPVVNEPDWPGAKTTPRDSLRGEARARPLKSSLARASQDCLDLSASISSQRHLLQSISQRLEMFKSTLEDRSELERRTKAREASRVSPSKQARIGALEELQAKTQCKRESKEAETTLDPDALHRRSLLRSRIARNSEHFFDQADADKSDDLCFDEFERICQSYVDKVDRGVVRSLFDEMAKGNDKISRARFSDVVAQLRAVRSFVSLSTCVDLLVDGLASMMFARPSQQGDTREFLAHITAEDGRALVATLPAALCAQAEVVKEQLNAHAKATADEMLDAAATDTGKFANLPEV